MTELLPEPGFFYTGCELHEGAPSYIERDADWELIQLATRGELCYVLAPSQMGKSSLINYARGRLRERGIASALVDLQQFSAGSSEDQWLVSFLEEVRAQLHIAIRPDDLWDDYAHLPPPARFVRYLDDHVAVLPRERVVIFVDEIGGIRRVPFGDDILRAIQSVHEPAGPRGVSFALFGAVPPETLASQGSALLPAGRRIYLGDLRLGDVKAWSRALPGAEAAALERIMHWTNGHPYLTQKIAQEIQDRGLASAAEVDALVDDLFLRDRWEDSNLAGLRARIERSDNVRALVNLYRAVRAGEPIPLDPSLLQEELRLTGLFIPVPGRTLRVHNRIYHAVFDERWIGRLMGG